jgi:hypothetical protein
MALVVEAHRLLQLALPDEAPGSNHVGNDVYVESLFVHFALLLPKHHISRRWTPIDADGKSGPRNLSQKDTFYSDLNYIVLPFVGRPD